MSENLKNFELEVSSGGGFTGAWTGTRISADGTVTRWKTGPHGAGRKDESAGRLTPAQLEGLLEALESASFFGMTLDQPGNMTTQISATSGGRHKEVRFSGMSDSAPSALQGVLSRFDTAVGSLK